MTYSELTSHEIHRVLVATQFEYCDRLFWNATDGTLKLSVICSDLFAWGSSDAEPIACEADVVLLERTLGDLQAAEGTKYPFWFPELYCARRRGMLPQAVLLDPDNKHYLANSPALGTEATVRLFRKAPEFHVKWERRWGNCPSCGHYWHQHGIGSLKLCNKSGHMGDICGCQVAPPTAEDDSESGI